MMVEGKLIVDGFIVEKNLASTPQKASECSKFWGVLVDDVAAASTRTFELEESIGARISTRRSGLQKVEAAARILGALRAFIGKDLAIQ